MEKKNLGWIILIIAILFLDPILGPSDAITLPIYSAYSGADISPGNLSSIYFDYFIWSSIVGIILLVIAMKLLGWSWKRLFQKLNITKYKTAIGLAIVAVLGVALFDIWSMNSGVFGSALEYTAGNFTAGWWPLFFKFVLMFFLVIPISYYFLVKKDFSESLAIFSASIIMFFGGLADIAYFIFQKSPIPSVLPHLNNHFFIGFISRNLGFEQVTSLSLIISVLASFLITILVVKVLKERF